LNKPQRQFAGRQKLGIEAQNLDLRGDLKMPRTFDTADIDSAHIVLKGWGDFHERLGHLTDSQWIFRGVSNKNHYLLPSIGRENEYGPYKKAQEIRLFQAFKNRGISLVHDTRFTEWDWLAFAQHVGVPTRLLDWSTSPLIAAFFALEKDSNEDRVIYCMKYSQYLFEVDHKNIDPFDNKVVGRFTAPLLFDRIRAQRGIFTIHPTPTEIFRHKSIQSFLLKSSMVLEFRKKLFKYGYDNWHIYPDIHGLGLQLRWQYKNKVGLGSIFMLKK
jgi:FRG domain